MPSYALLLPLILRSSSLLFPQTFFQPDEFYQSLEPAHQFVFGFGHLTWEWKDLPLNFPVGTNAHEGEWWTEVVVGGRMRSWGWPGVFVVIYQILKMTGLDNTFLLTFLPRVIGVIIAALTDWATYRLAGKLLGSGASAGGLFLSLTSLFHAHLLPRTLSTSPETLLTTLALVYFPSPLPVAPREIIVGDQGIKTSKSMRDIVTQPQIEDEAKPWYNERPGIVRLEDPGQLDHSLMDRMDQKLASENSIEASIFFAACAICLRPTTLPFWAFMGTELIYRTWRAQGIMDAMVMLSRAILTSLTVVIASAWLDFLMTGRFMIPTLTFIHRNIIQNISSFYGSTSIFYHLTQSLPLMLFPIWWWWAQGLVACLLPTEVLTKSLASLDRPVGMQRLARALTFGIAVLSLSPHSEWRFIHPFLPALLVYALPPMFRQSAPTIMGCWLIAQSIRQYTRLPKFAFYLCLSAPILPLIYLEGFHGRAQVEVMNVLRRGELGDITGVAALMPCYSTPWMSHLHLDEDNFFLTCDPPLTPSSITPTQQDLFYQGPVRYLQTAFPEPPGGFQNGQVMGDLPSHILLFGSLLDQVDHSGLGITSVREALSGQYEEAWSMWNGFDWAQDEPLRKGGVRVWRRRFVQPE